MVGVYIVARQHGVTLITQRRIVISNTSQKEDIDALQSVSLARTLIWDRMHNPPSLNLRLLRIFHSRLPTQPENIFQLVNSRHLVTIDMLSYGSVSSLTQLWNLETLGIFSGDTLLPEIWCMSQIRYVNFDYTGLRDPLSDRQNDIVLENLHTLVGVRDFKCSKEVVKRIPNLKKLEISMINTLDGRSCLNNLVCLHKLESLNCYLWSKMPLSGPDSAQSLNFPQSLKKLNLQLEDSDCWEDKLEKIGTLPLLEKLTLSQGCFEESKWETVEGQFQSLRYLEINRCHLKQWTMESSHFSRLEHLVLSYLYKLEEIPLEVAEIPTLVSIELIRCSESAVISARRIVEEHEESSGEATIQVLVRIGEKNEAVESLATHRNIRVEIKDF